MTGSVLLVLPTIDEVETIAEVIERATAAVPGLVVLVVDDGSRDGTVERVEERMLAAPDRVHLLRRPASRGLGDAYLAGFDWGLRRGFTVLVEMDADLQHDPDDLPRILAALHDADLVIGSRYVRGGSIAVWTPYRRFVSRSGNLVARGALRLPVRDVTSGFRAYRATLLRQIDLSTVATVGYGFQVEMVARAQRRRGRIREVPIHFADRVAGRSKLSSRSARETAVLVLRMATTGRPSRRPRPTDLRAHTTADCRPSAQNRIWGGSGGLRRRR